MALSEKIRSSIYQRFTELLGEEEAAALLSQYPASDLDVPATKEFVRAELAEFRVELAELRGDLDSGLAGLRIEIAGLEARMNEKFRQQTMWMAGTMLTGISVAAAVTSLLT